MTQPNYEYQIEYGWPPMDKIPLSELPYVADKAKSGYKIWDIRESTRLDSKGLPLIMIILRRERP